MPDRLRIQLLGGFHLSLAGRPILSAESASGQSLVAYLLLRRDAAQPRQQLAFQLWPDSTEAQAMSNLRALLVRLRRAWPALERYVEIGSRTLRWRDEADFRLDVAEYEAALLRAEQEPDQRRAALEQAIHHYHGDLFPGGYQDWILPERERLRQSFLRALDELGGVLEASGEFGAAIGHTQQRLQHDPLDESTYLRLMRLHARRGDRAGVMRVFDTCRTTLQRELAVEPSASTRDFYEQLLREPPVRQPPAPSPIRAPHNLSHPLTSFVGRVRELNEIKQRLREARLLTLTGAGGSGKTRLALQAAFDVVPEYPDGVWWVDLAPLAEAQMVARTVASILGVQEQPDRPLIETLSGAIGSRRLLLILDNCEHLVAECATLSRRLLPACPNLIVFATSRESLGLTGENIWPVPPLSLPSKLDIGRVEQSEAVRLFVERAALALPTFALTQHNRDAVVQVCRQLDGIPLAIELAAARVKVLAVDQIAARLDDRFNLLMSGDRAALPRHQTLRAMVDWSYGLLSEPEQALFRQLSVLVSGFTLEAADAVGDVDLDQSDSVLENLSRLIDKSLVVAEEAMGKTMRYRMLETIRQYALEKLRQANEIQSARERHAHFFAHLAEEADPHLQTSHQQGEWLPRLESDHGNLRAALGWCLDSATAEMALRLGGHLGWFWVQRSEFIEGRQWLERALALPDANRYPHAYARALVFVGILAFLQTEEKEARPWLEQALSVARAHAERLTTADALNFLGLVALRERDIASARSCLEESQALFRELGEWTGYARTVWHLGFVMERERDAAAVLTQYEQALALLREWGDPLRQSAVLRSIGWNQYELGDHAGGRRSLRESLTLAQSIGHKAGIAHTLRAIAERIEADPERAVRLLMVVVNLYHSLGSTTYGQAVLDLDVAQRRAQLDETAFTRARESGRAMTTEQAIHDALLVE